MAERWTLTIRIKKVELLFFVISINDRKGQGVRAGQDRWIQWDLLQQESAAIRCRKLIWQWKCAKETQWNKWRLAPHLLFKQLKMSQRYFKNSWFLDFFQIVFLDFIILFFLRFGFAKPSGMVKRTRNIQIIRCLFDSKGVVKWRLNSSHHAQNDFPTTILSFSSQLNAFLLFCRKLQISLRKTEQEILPS